MKEYKKKYEDVYTSSRFLNRCKIWKVSTVLDFDELKYRKTLRIVLRQYQSNTFNMLLKNDWLVHHFCYNGVQRMKSKNNGIVLDRSYGIYMRHYVGYDNKSISCNQLSSSVISYFEDFFPNFYSLNPLKKRFKYPYSYMNFECLFLVYQMPERLDLLKIGEKKRMRYTKFVDYVINYALSKTDELNDENYFSIAYSGQTKAPFIRYKYYERKK